MNTVGDLKLLPVWMNPPHLALTALHVMLGHKVKALGVLDGTKLVGIITLEDLLAAPDGALVRDVMHVPERMVSAGNNVREVAQEFVNEGLEFAPVVDGEHFLGILTPVLLLRELGRSYDPLTGLSWSDRLREWGIDHLKNGEEVTIIFIDLNLFGVYNKKYGHIVGDRVLQKVARHLSEHLDNELDLLVRYGGDEFAIGTLRDRDETEAFSELLSKRFDGRMEGAAEPVGFMTGLFGGRRHRERENVHYAATIDNLINMASKQCSINKLRARGEPIPETLTERKVNAAVRVLGVYTDESSSSGVSTVILSYGESIVSGADARGEKTMAHSLAAATAKALERAMGDAPYEVLAVEQVESTSGNVVSVTGSIAGGSVERSVSGVRPVVQDLATAVVEATIQAFAP